jgi:hypothetical protein
VGPQQFIEKHETNRPTSTLLLKEIRSEAFVHLKHVRQRGGSKWICTPTTFRPNNGGLS